jgi:predicted ATP-dependent Lon-type protease
MDPLDWKLNVHYAGRVVRKDLLHQIKRSRLHQKLVKAYGFCDFMGVLIARSESSGI